MNALILYYSYGGNTRKIAEMIQKEIGGDSQEIKTAVPYTGSYNAIVNQGQQEVDSGYMPEIEPLAADIKDYDCVVLGTPVWWYTFAPAVKTMLAQTDFAGKNVYPFATNGGWLGHTLQDFAKEVRNGKVNAGLGIKFDEHTLCTSEEDIKNWIRSIQA